MRFLSLFAIFVAFLGPAGMPIQAQAPQLSKKTVLQEAQRMNSLAGKTIRWTFVDGPVASSTFEYSFNEDGSVTWRIVEGEHKGYTAREKSYAAVRVNERTWAISY